MIDSTPRFLNGAFEFTGTGLTSPALLHPSLAYRVPSDRRAQLIYMRCGNSCAELAYLALVKDGETARIFPIGAKGSLHVPLAVVEDLQPDTHIEVFFAAPAGISGTFVLDLGIIEI